MIPLKKILTILSISFLLFANAQVQDTVSAKKMYVKANALFLPVGVVNAALEYQLSKKKTVQAEIFISPWKSFAGHAAQIYMIGFDGRYYFNEAFKHWYVGANVSVARFIIRKYNYWGNGTFQYREDSPVYNLPDIYQDGYAIMIGATAGYQFQLNERWNLDLYLTAGSVQSFYKGYVKSLRIRYDTDSAPGFNRSGEFLPYKGGIMISYKLR